VTVNDYTAAPEAEFQELLDRIEREPEAPEAWATVERVAEAIRAEWGNLPDLASATECAPILAVAAVVAIDTGQQTAAITRMLALADDLLQEATVWQKYRSDERRLLRETARRIRAAVAGQP
jgi:hypothetical protein